MADLVVVVPTRGRPDQAVTLAQACAETCTADTVLLFAVDADDPELPRYLATVGRRALLTVAPAASGHVGAINWAAAEALVDHRPAAIAKLDDDHRPRTVGWDTEMLLAVAHLGGGIVYGNDLFQGAALPTAPAISANIVRALGYMGPPVLGHLYVDDYWRDLGKAAECLRYLPKVVVEHMHPAAGKAALDDGYRRVNAAERYEADGAAYRAFLAGPFADDVAKVRALRGLGP